MSLMRHRWAENLCDVFEHELSLTKRCRGHRCLRGMNILFLKARMPRVIEMSADDRRKELGKCSDRRVHLCLMATLFVQHFS